MSTSFPPPESGAPAGVPSPQQPAPKTRHSGFTGGLVLIFIGLAFLLQRFGALGEHFNWWAIFIFIPAFSSLAGAWYAWQRGGRFNAAVRSGLGGGLIVLTVALMFLFDLDWSVWWPLMIIMPGLGILLNGIPDPQSTPAPGTASLLNMGIWTGGTMILLGLTFLANRLGYFSLDVFGTFRWYGAFVFLPGLGALFNAFMLYRSEGRLTAAATSLMGLGLVICLVGAVILIGLDWNLITPVALIGAGVALLAGWIWK